ncbi:MAG: bifunctional precorrin-2 dehydrogenase/sirohydrochlorin ferrochelatase [Microthrixaceae bacterium]|nr:bifunctional precorrin-2 dehydrogenase/sirohydrochlorin ferrochelatase [Microthrixaceae bacterium]
MSTTTSSTQRPPAYPVNLEIAGLPALVVGGGPVAARKAAGLIRSGAQVTVVAPEIIDDLRDNPSIRCIERTYQRGEAASYRVVISATGRKEIDSQVSRDAQATGIPVNSADDPGNCSFTLPAIARAGEIQVTVSTSGRSPAMATWLRDRVAETLDQSMVDTLELLARVRSEVIAAGQSTEVLAWRRALDAGLVELIADGQHEAAEKLLRAELGADGLHTGASAAASVTTEELEVSGGIR